MKLILKPSVDTEVSMWNSGYNKAIEDFKKFIEDCRKGVLTNRQVSILLIKLRKYVK